MSAESGPSPSRSTSSPEATVEGAHTSASAAPAAGSARASRRVAAVVAFAALTALAARLAVPLPGTAVPFTLQVAAVLLAGFLLGPRLGAASQGLYVAAGVAGLPVFAAGGGPVYLLGPTGGYLLAYPAAAAVAGWFARRGGLLGLGAGGLLGLATIHLGGASWLAVGVGPEAALRIGVIPFLAGDLLKVALAALLAHRLEGRARRLLGSG